MTAVADQSRNQPLADVIDLANYVIKSSFSNRRPIDSIQLQKLLFFAQELFIGKTGSPLFGDEVLAQEYGPTIPRVFSHYIKYAGDKLIHVDEDRAQSAKQALDSNGEDYQRELDDIVDAYGRLDASQLIMLSHVKGFAWDRVYNKGGNGNGDGKVISLDEMRKDSQNINGVNAEGLFKKVRDAVGSL